MTHKQSLWDYPVVHFPRKAMHADGFPVSTAGIHNPVAPFFFGSGPKPTSFGLFNHSPKADFERGSFYCHSGNLAHFTLGGNA